MNKTDYYMDACEILRFPSEIKAVISPSLFHCVAIENIIERPTMKKKFLFETSY